MANQDYGSFIVKILSTLKKNGYPEKRVSLPLEKMYEVAYEKGLNFNKVLDFLKEKGTLHEKTAEKIIFYPEPEENDVEASDSADEIPDMAQMMQKAQEMMKQMSPQQIADLQRMFTNMDDSQKEAIMKQAKDMGMF